MWRHWLADGGILAELAGLIATDQPTNGARVASIRNRLADRKSITNMVENTRRDLGGRGKKITGRALSQFEGRLAPLLELAEAWEHIVAAAPVGTGRTGATVESLRKDFDQLAPTARNAIDQMEHANPATPLASALIRTSEAIASLHAILHRQPDVEAAVSRVQALSDDLLFVPGLEITPMGEVDESTSRDTVLDRLLDTDSHAGSLSAAFNLRLDQGDLHGGLRRLYTNGGRGRPCGGRLPGSSGHRIDRRAEAIPTQTRPIRPNARAGIHHRGNLG